jgi:DNA-binding MarR family transcriptional regulator
MNTKKASQKSEALAAMVNEVTRDCLMTRSRRISRVITSLFDEELRPFGVSSSQFSLLVLVAGMDGASRAEIGRANHQERSTSTRNLQLVLDQGWVEERIPEKGRRRSIVISKAGRELLTQAMPAWRAAQVQATQLLGDNGASAIVELSARLPVEELAG